MHETRGDVERDVDEVIDRRQTMGEEKNKKGTIGKGRGREREREREHVEGS